MTEIDEEFECNWTRLVGRKDLIIRSAESALEGFEARLEEE